MRSSSATAGASSRSAACATSRRSTARSRSSTAAASARPRARRLPHARVLRRRSRRRVRASRSRRELRGAARRRGGDPLDGRGDPGGGRGRRLAAPSDGTASGCSAPARRPSRGSRATGSTARPSSRRCARSRRGRYSDVAGGARRSARARRRGRLPRLRARRGAARGGRGSPRRPTSSSSVAPSTPSRRAATSRRAAARALTLRLHGDQFTGAGAIPLAIELGARSVDHLEATGRRGRPGARRERRRRRAPAGGALFLGRPMPPARELVDAGAAVALATDFNPGSAFCESLPLVCSLACTQLGLSPAEALGAVTVNAAHVLGRADRIGGSRPGYDADIVLLDAPDWRHLAYHLGGESSSARRPVRTAVAWRRAHTSRVPTRKQRRRRRRSSATSTRYVYVDEEGTRSRSSRSRGRAPDSDGRGKPRSDRLRRARRRSAAPIPPSWRRSRRRGLIFAPLFFAFLLLTSLIAASRSRRVSSDALPPRGLPARSAT